MDDCELNQDSENNSDVFNGIKVLQSDEIVKDKFKVELNLGLALPCVFRPGEGYNLKQENKAVVKYVKEDGSVIILGVSTQSDMGPLGGVDFDVLTVLLTMAWEQKAYGDTQENKNGFRVFYTLAEICRRLGLSSNTSSSISNSIEKIKSQKLNLKNFLYSAKTKDTALAKENTRLVLKSGETILGTSNKDFSDYNKTFWVEFDSFIMKNMQNDYVGLVKQKEYLSLKSGPQRRILMFLNSKRRGLTDQFVFNLEELASIIGIQNSSSKRKLVDRYLKQLRDKINSFEYKIEQEHRKGGWNILIYFHKAEDLIEEDQLDSFYKELEKFYSKEALRGVDIEEIDVVNLRKEFNRSYLKKNGHEKIIFGKDELDPAEFAIDLALYQVLTTNYKVTKSFKALLKSIYKGVEEGIYELPGNYRYFVTKRNKDIEKKTIKELISSEVIKKREMKKREEEDLEKSFNLFYKDIVSNNKSYKRKLEERAKKILDNDQNLPLFGLLLETEMRKIAKAEFLSGDILDDKDIGRASKRVEFVKD